MNKEQNKWQHFSTAPKDRTIEVLYEYGDQCLAYWSDNRRCMLGRRAGSFAPGWAVPAEGEADTDLPLDPFILWREYVPASAPKPFPTMERAEKESREYGFLTAEEAFMGAYDWLISYAAPTPQEGRPEADERLINHRKQPTQFGILNLVKGGEDYTNGVFDYILMLDKAIDANALWKTLADALKNVPATLPTHTKGRQLYEVVPEEDYPHFGTRLVHWLYVPYLDNWLRPVSTPANIEAQDTEGQKGGGC